jgi:HSP20 family protein
MTSVTVRDPFAEMRSIMRRSFDEPFFARQRRGHFAPITRHEPEGSSGLALNVYETDEGLSVEAPIPGFSKDDVDVVLEKGKLTIRAEKAETSEPDGTGASEDGETKAPSDEAGRTYFVRERPWGNVSRSLLVGDSWDADSIAGVLKDGVLVLTIKKAKSAQPRHVEIS